MRHPLSTASTIALLLLSSLPAFADDWPSPRHDNQQTARSPVSFDPRSLALAWHSPFGCSNPVVAGNIVFSNRTVQLPDCSTHFSVAAFDRASGSPLWSFDDNFYRVSPPVFADGLLVYTATRQTFTHELFDYGLYVHDAATGALLYRQPIAYDDYTVPLTLQHQTDGSLIAYHCLGSITAWQIGRSSASLQWVSDSTYYGSHLGPATLVGDSILAANTGQGWIFNRADGTGHRFWGGANSGGYGVGISFDSASNRLFLASDSAALSAFQFVDPDHIQPLWNARFTNIVAPAIDSDGSLYAVHVASGNTGPLQQLDPLTGLVLRSSSASDYLWIFGHPPVLQSGYLWAVAQGPADRTTELRALDLDTLQVVRTFSSAPAELNFRPPVLADNTMILPYEGFATGFDVYLIPEPSLLLPLAFFLLPRRH